MSRRTEDRRTTRNTQSEHPAIQTMHTHTRLCTHTRPLLCSCVRGMHDAAEKRKAAEAQSSCEEQKLLLNRRFKLNQKTNLILSHIWGVWIQLSPGNLVGFVEIALSLFTCLNNSFSNCVQFYPPRKDFQSSSESISILNLKGPERTRPWEES